MFGLPITLAVAAEITKLAPTLCIYAQIDTLISAVSKSPRKAALLLRQLRC